MGNTRLTPQEHLDKDLEQEMWTIGFSYSWRKMDLAAEDGVGCTESEKAQVKS